MSTFLVTVSVFFEICRFLMEISPERTLAYLRKLDVSTYSAGDRAYFSLLFTQATDKNMLSLLPCDSLIDTALDYYIKKMVSIWLKLGFIKAGFKKNEYD